MGKTDLYQAAEKLWAIHWDYKIILIPKPNRPLDLKTSYRPISLLPFFTSVKDACP